MNEKLNLVEILKDCTEGTKLYSPIFGGSRINGSKSKKESRISHINQTNKIAIDI